MRRTFRISQVVVLSSYIFVGLAHAQVQTDASGFPWEGEVTGTNVYVRSGAGTNYYPTTKLHTGDRVLVHGEKFGWYRISPPANSFSYIDKTKVQRSPGAPFAVVNQDQTYTRAGSHLVSRKTSTQVILNKGSRVEIIGESDGFFRIKPPNEARLYMSKQYIRKVAANKTTGLLRRFQTETKTTNPTTLKKPPTKTNIVTKETPSKPEAARVIANKPAEPSGSGKTSAKAKTNGIPSVQKTARVAKAPVDQNRKTVSETSQNTTPKNRGNLTAAPVVKSTGRYQALLTTAESDLNVVMSQPLESRDLEPLIKQYEEIANQNEERIPSEYAGIRIRQLRNLVAVRAAKKEIESDAESLGAFQANLSSQRMDIMRAKTVTVPVKFDLEGELRKSYAFSSKERRYRLVDPKRQTTIAYVDIPAEVQQNADHMIGKLVGIRISGQRFSPSARIPIAEASSIAELSRQNTGNTVIIPGGSSSRQNTKSKTSNTMTVIRMEPVRSVGQESKSGSKVAAVEASPEQE